jgi:hypothetical protein
LPKILVPLLQVWLYASRAEGRFEKRYPELCEVLDIVCHKHLSLIRRQLEPSLTELTQYGYLAAWAIQPTVDGREYKLVATHGVLPGSEDPQRPGRRLHRARRSAAAQTVDRTWNQRRPG